MTSPEGQTSRQEKLAREEVTSPSPLPLLPSSAHAGMRELTLHRSLNWTAISFPHTFPPHTFEKASLEAKVEKWDALGPSKKDILKHFHERSFFSACTNRRDLTTTSQQKSMIRLPFCGNRNIKRFFLRLLTAPRLVCSSLSFKLNNSLFFLCCRCSAQHSLGKWEGEWTTELFSFSPVFLPLDFFSFSIRASFYFPKFQISFLPLPSLGP